MKPTVLLTVANVCGLQGRVDMWPALLLSALPLLLALSDPLSGDIRILSHTGDLIVGALNWYHFEIWAKTYEYKLN